MNSMLPSSRADPRRDRVLEALLARNNIEPTVRARAEQLASHTRRPAEQVLNQMGVVSDRDLANAYAEVCGCEVWDPDLQPPLEVDDSQIQHTFLEEHRLIVLDVQPEVVVVAASDPLDDEGFAGLAFATGRNVVIKAALPGDYRRAAHDRRGAPEPEGRLDDLKLQADVERVLDIGADSQAARLLGSVLEAALARRASDIHFDPWRHDFRIRLRVDGRLAEYQVAASDLAAPVIIRIKVLANLDLGERRLPQDGRATFVVEGRSMETRVSIVPSVFGEAAVLRVLDLVGVDFDLARLGVAEPEAAILTRAAHANHGIFLLAGPTGSGKTTTLYALLNSLAGAEKKILSIEDPVEHHFRHVNQIQVAPQIGLTFAHALRSFLRQDPDVILVGEIRDAETAAVAIQAAMTGHLVLASTHANDAVRAVPRLIDMGVEPYQMGAALLGSAAQRLVRRLCMHCRTERRPREAEQVFVAAVGGEPPERAWHARGCDRCGGTGYAGRVALLEAFICDDALSGVIARGEPIPVLAELSRACGRRSMEQDGVAKAAAGLTTLSEIMAVVGA